MTTVFQGGQDVTDTEDEDVFDEEEIPLEKSPFTRGFKHVDSVRLKSVDGPGQPGQANHGLPRSSSSLARLSMFIRRSLRIPFRSQRSFTGDHSKWDGAAMENARCFTSNSPTKMGPSEVPNRLDELLDNKRLNRIQRSSPAPRVSLKDVSKSFKSSPIWRSIDSEDSGYSGCSLESSDDAKSRSESESQFTLSASSYSIFHKLFLLKTDHSKVINEITIKNFAEKDTVKSIIRKTDWPPRHEIRQTLWKELCRGKDFDSSRSLYISELENVKRSKRTTHPHFLKEDGVVIHNFDLNERGALNLMSLLTVIERMRPEVTSAPILYPLCALMLHFLDEADVFACIQYLLSSKGFIMTSPIQWTAAPYTICALIKKHKANAYNLLKRRLNTDDDNLIMKTMTDWLSWIFGGLPFMHVCRVVDCFLVEGHKFFIRTAISIVYIWSKMQKTGQFDDLSGKSQDERINVIKDELMHTAQHIGISTDTFILTAIKIRNLRSSTIARFQAQFEEKVKAEWSHKRHSVVRRDHRDIFTESFKSDIVDSEVAIDLMAALPPRLQLATPVLLFRLSQDGASFTKLWNNIDEASQTLILIRTSEGDIFGAFCSSPWSERNDRRERSKTKYFGTGESFVWRLDKKLGFPVIYFWAGRDAAAQQDDDIPQMFMTAGDKLMVIGSGSGDAIRISEELTQGMSRACKTFNSPALVEDEAYLIDELEVFEVLTSV
ncbi:hypothetical protein WR25_07425 [Diploscapter pachys]|uniref:TLDc domain-containing protein n=1 Tax=Diploscapter pachys TaxID=2018661 RepID=A0A2A2KXQ6_9BILA|nr:hypothetical protein WR25_07425 [Diploscapter pachys]